MRVTGAFECTNLTVPIHKLLFVINKKQSDLKYGLLIHQSRDLEFAKGSFAECRPLLAGSSKGHMFFTPWLKIKTVYMI